jgi:hypothetical protein
MRWLEIKTIPPLELIKKMVLCKREKEEKILKSNWEKSLKMKESRN